MRTKRAQLRQQARRERRARRRRYVAWDTPTRPIAVATLRAFAALMRRNTEALTVRNGREH